MSTSEDGVPGEARERLEWIMIGLVGIASRPKIGPDARSELTQLADQICLLLEG